VPLGGHEKLELQSIEIPLLARDIAPLSLLVIEVCLRKTIIITHRDRKAIKDAD